MAQTLTDEQRKDLFRELVEMQDGGTAVPDSRKQIAEKFSLSEEDVRVIERAGIAANWPPLD